MMWMAREQFEAQLQGFEFTPDHLALADQFEAYSRLMAQTAENLRAAGDAELEHFGDG